MYLNIIIHKTINVVVLLIFFADAKLRFDKNVSFVVAKIHCGQDNIIALVMHSQKMNNKYIVAKFTSRVMPVFTKFKSSLETSPLKISKKLKTANSLNVKFTDSCKKTKF